MVKVEVKAVEVKTVEVETGAARLVVVLMIELSAAVRRTPLSRP